MSNTNSTTITTANSTRPKITTSNRRGCRKRFSKQINGKNHNQQTDINIAYINLNGARKAPKWFELTHTCKLQNIDVCLVVETHLRDLEVPELQDEWIWNGLNRTGKAKKGGGIGILSKANKTNFTIKIIKECSEHMWCQISTELQSIIIAIVYLATGESRHLIQENNNIRTCLQNDLSSLCIKPAANILILGDLNAHIEELGGAEDAGGRELKAFCSTNNLIILNTEEICEGTYTWNRGKSKSAIDYVLASPNFTNSITKMFIDEDGTIDIDSDHNFILLTCTLSTHNKRPNKIPNYTRSVKPRWKVSDSTQLKLYSEAIEHTLSHPNYVTDYTSFTRLITDTALRFCGKAVIGLKKSRNRPKWINDSIITAINNRKKANREHRKSLKNLEPEATRLTKWKIYKTHKTAARKLISNSIRTVDKRLEAELLKNDPNSTRKFWRYLKRHKKDKEITKLFNNDKNSYTEDPEEIKHIIQKRFGEKCQQNDTVVPGEDHKDHPQIRDTEKVPLITVNELTKEVKKLKKGKACGPEDIPNELIVALGPLGINTLHKIFNDILEGTSPIPPAWKTAHIKLIFKGKKKDPNNIDSYRPIALLSSLYKLYASIIKNRLDHLLYANNTIGDMQNGFRKGRNASDCHFIISQLIEIAKRKNSPLYIALLDIKGAYDNVNRTTLWKRLKDLKIPCNLVEHLESLYFNTTSIFFWNNIETQQISIQKGVRQGCPLSTTLFIAYMQRLEDLLNSSNKGVTFGEDTPQHPTTICNGTMFADDVTIFSDSPEGLISQLKSASTFADESDLEFCETKSEIIIFNKEANHGTFQIQNKNIPIVNNAKILGINITNETENCYAKTDQDLINKAKKMKGIIKSSSLNSFNKAVVSRTLWKQVATPSLTYINDIICYENNTLKELDRQQVDMGKYALGANYISPHISIEGEMGWSNFEAREARSKISYRGKMLLNSKDHMTRKIFDYTSLTVAQTKWQKRTTKLMNRFKTQNELPIHNTTDKWKKNTKTQVNKTNEVRWQENVLKKPSLTIYRVKNKPKWDHIYDNSLGSDLLFQARTGSLPTSSREAEILGGNQTCKLCNAPVEDVVHVITTCPSLQDQRNQLTSLTESDIDLNNPSDLTRYWLGLHHKKSQNRELLQATKDLLENWWKLAKNRQPYWRR